MAAGKKSDSHEINERVMYICSLLINGYSSTEIAHDGALLRKWDVNPRQIWVYISRARDSLQEDAMRSREAEIGKAIRRYEKMYRKMEAVCDYRGCLSAQSRIDDLLALCGTKKIDITTKGEAIRSTTPELAAHLSEMSAEDIANFMRAGRGEHGGN